MRGGQATPQALSILRGPFPNASQFPLTHAADRSASTPAKKPPTNPPGLPSTNGMGPCQRPAPLSPSFRLRFTPGLVNEKSANFGGKLSGLVNTENRIWLKLDPEGCRRASTGPVEELSPCSRQIFVRMCCYHHLQGVINGNRRRRYALRYVR